MKNIALIFSVAAIIVLLTQCSNPSPEKMLQQNDSRGKIISIMLNDHSYLTQLLDSMMVNDHAQMMLMDRQDMMQKMMSQMMKKEDERKSMMDEMMGMADKDTAMGGMMCGMMADMMSKNKDMKKSMMMKMNEKGMLDKQSMEKNLEPPKEISPEEHLKHHKK